MIAQLGTAAVRGCAPVAAQMASGGFLKHLEAQIAWIERHRALFE